MIPASFERFDTYFTGKARSCLLTAVELALTEDGRDLTSLAICDSTDVLHAQLVAKESCVICGLPLIPIVLSRIPGGETVETRYFVDEGARVPVFTILADMRGPASVILAAERIILNFMTHMCGVASTTSDYVEQLEGTGVKLLDTRKTLPGLRYPEKYAVTVGGGHNHRADLESMILVKDNHIDQAGSIPEVARRLGQGPLAARVAELPLEIECRTLAEVEQAVAVSPTRIMLDNMDDPTMRVALSGIPASIETEISGNVSLETIRDKAQLGPTYISVGKLTHSAPACDLSLRYAKPGESL